MCNQLTTKVVHTFDNEMQTETILNVFSISSTVFMRALWMSSKKLVVELTRARF